MKTSIVAFLAGVIFAVGLGVGGMTQPAKVIGFLDVASSWDPSLACVMLGAIAVYAVCYRQIRKRPAPILTPTFSVPTRTDLDPRLLGGAILFGIGWGLAGFCPRPALTALASGSGLVVVFVIRMLAGMFLFQFVDSPRHRRAATLNVSHPSHLSAPATHGSPALGRHDA